MNRDTFALLAGRGVDSGLSTLLSREPGDVVTHDYTRRYFGHDYAVTPIDGGQRATLIGWGYGIANGDYLLLQNGAGSTRYQVDEISYYQDPPDMWRAKATFAPRQAVS